jgi:hypothetical protein
MPFAEQRIAEMSKVVQPEKVEERSLWALETC